MSVSVQAETTDSAKYQAWQASYALRRWQRAYVPRYLMLPLTVLRLASGFIELDRKQPEFTLTLDEYLTRVISNTRIKNAKRRLSNMPIFWMKYQKPMACRNAILWRYGALRQILALIRAALRLFRHWQHLPMMGAGQPISEKNC